MAAPDATQSQQPASAVPSHLDYARGMSGIKHTGLTPGSNPSLGRTAQVTETMTTQVLRGAQANRIATYEKELADYNASWFKSFRTKPQAPAGYNPVNKLSQSNHASSTLSEFPALESGEQEVSEVTYVENGDNFLEFGDEEVTDVTPSLPSRIFSAILTPFKAIGNFFKMIITCGCFTREAKVIDPSRLPEGVSSDISLSDASFVEVH